MTYLALIRHAPTPWNREGRLQGRTDIPLDAIGEAEAAGWCLPENVKRFRFLSSPLLRTRKTAEIISMGHFEIDDRLIETNWASWEGMALKEFREKYGDGADRDGLRGLDFCAPGGDSPRDIQQRIYPLLREIGSSQEDTIAVTHKGVIRAIYAAAIGWDMISKPPKKLRNELHLFRLSEDGTPVVDALNVSLTPV